MKLPISIRCLVMNLVDLDYYRRPVGTDTIVENLF